ncbi:MAG: VOC family protein [bacterium]|nr:VOC family protein [bacterium]
MRSGFILLILIPYTALFAASNVGDDMANETPNVNIRFLYNYCNDLAEMRNFYTELLGMKETAFNEEWNFLCYQTEGMDFMFFGNDEEIPVRTEFADQPGWMGGELPITSWTLDIPEEEYAETIARLKAAGVSSSGENPHWEQDSYWCFPVLDPMGNTVEITTVPKDKPADTEWPGE